MRLTDFRHAWRSLLQRPQRAFTFAMVASFALGIGAASAIFSLVQVMLLAPLPYADATQVQRVYERNPSRGLAEFSVSTPDFLDWQRRATSFDALAALSEDNVNLGAAGSFERVRGLRASASVFRVLGQPLLAGREFTAAEDRPGGAPVVILGEGLWRSRFGADPALVGRSVTIDGEARSVVGIAPQDVGFATDIGVWLPLTPDPELYGRGDRRLEVLGRLRAGVDAAAAQAELDAISAALAREYPSENRGWEGALEPVRAWIVGDAVRDRLLLLSAAVLVLLLVACTNVANLQLARASARQRELGVREALGAPRSRLLAQTLAEGLLLVVVGGAIGVLFAAAALQLAGAWLPASTPRLALVALDWRAVLVATAAAAATAIAFGLLPTQLGRGALAATLQLGRSASAAPRSPLRQALVVAQFTFATLLVTAAALLAQHLDQLQDATLGFRPERLLVARLTVPQANENVDLTPHVAQFERLVDALRTLPGVEAVGIGSEIPLGDFNTTSMMVAAGAGGPLTYEQDSVQASWRVVSADFLGALGVPLLRGRGFASSDESPRSMLLSDGLARQLWPDGRDPVGQTVRLGNGQQRTIVGVVGDVRQRELGGPPTPTMYMPTTWIVTETMTLVVRSEADPLALVAPVRETAARVAPGQPLFDLQTMQGVLSTSVAEPRMQTGVLLAFALSSLVLAAFGVAGVLAYLVARRTPELAVRMALGASPQRLVGQVMRHGGLLCAIGIGLGAALLLLGAPAWRPLLPDVEPAGMLGLGATLLLGVGALASWLPARRAARVEPNAALRDV